MCQVGQLRQLADDFVLFFTSTLSGCLLLVSITIICCDATKDVGSHSLSLMQLRVLTHPAQHGLLHVNAFQLRTRVLCGLCPG